MTKPILVCDVDGVVVDLSLQWYEYLCQISEHPSRENPEFSSVIRDYDFHKSFRDCVSREQAHSFWKSGSLYDHASPVEGSTEFIQSFIDSGWDVVFVSHTEGSHAKSKYDFLKRHFKFDGFIATREKHFVKANIAVDDLLKHLSNHAPEVMKVLKDTPYNRGGGPDSLNIHRVIDLGYDCAKDIIDYWELVHIWGK